MPEKAKPNEPCPCGSGLKYKRCCAIEDKADMVRRRRIRIVRNIGLVIGLIGLVLLISYNSGTSANRGGPPGVAPLRPTQTTPGSQPPGPAPPGKVWSAEHGHWHDAPGGATTPGSQLPGSQPPGPAPPGKVWSAEHGHWHDAPDASTTQPANQFTPAPAPPGDPPPGKIWSQAHGHWHDLPDDQPTDNNAARTPELPPAESATPDND